MMRDSQQSSLQVDTHLNTMALKAISPVPLKDLSLVSFENPEDDLGEENFSLHLSEDEDDEKTDKKKNVVTAKEENKDLECPTIEPTSDNLNCVNIEEKSVNNSVNDKVVNECVENVNSELCKKNDNLNSVNEEIKPNQCVDDDANEAGSTIIDNKDAVNQNCENEDKISEQEKIDTIKNDIQDESCKPVEQDDKVEKSLEQKTDDSNDETQKEKSLTDTEVTSVVEEAENKKEEAAKEEKNGDESTETEIKDVVKTDNLEKTNADILKDQIMDTEDLLQIVENDTEENDKDSLKSGDKADSEDNEPEADKNDVDEEDEDQAEEDKDEAEAEKAPVEEEKDGAEDEKGDVEIEENQLSKHEMDDVLDKEYRDILNDVDITTDKEPPKTNKKVEEVPITENSVEVLPSSTEKRVAKRAKLEEDEGLSDVKAKSAKRLLNDEAVVKSDAKKAKLEPVVTETVSLDMEVTNDVDLSSREKLREAKKKKAILSTIAKFLQKKMVATLTYEDLEEICMQKICEAICYKSEIGEIRHQLGVQEQMAEMWRKEVAQLSKQARDLEIVNKRLLHEVRLKNERDKPLVPVKITRSVGLQVRSDTSMMSNVLNPKRRSTVRSPGTPVHSSPNLEQNRTPPPPRTVTPVRTPPPTRVLATTRTTQPTRPPIRSSLGRPLNSGVNKVATTAPVTKMAPTSSVNKISPANNIIKYKVANKGNMLTQVLQNTTNSSTNNASTASGNSISAVPISSLIPVSSSASNVSSTASKGPTYKPNITPKKIIATKGVIDLTDEDSTSNKTTSSSITKPTQGVRIVTANKTTTVTSSSTIGSQSRIMYLYNNSVLPQGNQKVMVKLPGSANSVIGSISNGSISVGGSPLRTGPMSQVKVTNQVNTARISTVAVKTNSKHPAPLPAPPLSQLSVTARKSIPPKPHLSIKRSSGGIVLSWKMPYNLENYESIVSYQLYAYQETSAPPSSDMWRKVGDVKALALPMACTLTQFADGNKYHFAVRAVDVHKRMGPFSDSEQILL